MDKILQKLQTYSRDDITDEVLNQIGETIMFRLANSLTEEDFEKIQSFDKIDVDGTQVFSYMKSKIPQIESIIEEEIKRSTIIKT